MLKKISVIKYDKSRQAYDQQKVLTSILRSGVKKEQALNVLGRIEASLYDNISTQKLYKKVEEEINRQKLPQHARFYRLREVLAKMDPIDFERFIKKFLEKEGYSCRWNVIVNGFCIEHQVDVIAENKKGETFFVEVKRHRRFHRDCGLGDVAELWARLEDIQKKHQFSTAWLITNTKFSQHAKKYARCKELKMTGWRYNLEHKDAIDSQNGLEKKIEEIGRDKVDAIIKKVCSFSTEEHLPT